MIAAALHRMAAPAPDDGQIRFARLDASGTQLVSVSWGEVGGALGREPPAPPPREIALGRPSTWAPRQSRLRATLRRMVAAMPPRLQRSLFVFVGLQIGAFRAFGEAASQWRRAQARQTKAQTPTVAADPNAPEAGARGDVLLLLGPESWRVPPEVARRARAERGMRVALLSRDILPLIRPDFFDRATAASCRAWHREILANCDRALTDSPVLAEIVSCHAATEFRVVRLGSSNLCETSGAWTHPAPQPRRPYILCAAPLDVSENHELLLRVWRRMTERRAAGTTPMLVLAGPMGRLVDDLLRQLGNTDCLEGAIQIIQHPAPSDLAILYRDCLFTVCVSLHPGGARQVEQSFALGKPCVGSALARPEAGADLMRSFAPEHLGEAYDAICDAIDDAAGLAAWARRIETEFRPTSWDEAAAALVEACGADGGT